MSLLLKIFIGLETALAQGAESSGGNGGSSGIQLINPIGSGGGSVGDVLCTIGGWLFRISIPLSAIMIIVGAFQIMFAGGNEEKIKVGKHTIIYTIVGFAIILLSTGIIFVIQQLLGTSNTVCGQSPADTTPYEFQGETGPTFPYPPPAKP